MIFTFLAGISMLLCPAIASSCISYLLLEPIKYPTETTNL